MKIFFTKLTFLKSEILIKHLFVISIEGIFHLKDISINLRFILFWHYYHNTTKKRQCKAILLAYLNLKCFLLLSLCIFFYFRVNPRVNDHLKNIKKSIYTVIKNYVIFSGPIHMKDKNPYQRLQKSIL